MRKQLWISTLLLASIILLGCKTTEEKKFALPEANNYEESARKLSAAEINATDKDGNSILHIAAQRNNADLILYLLAKGADSRIINREKDSALNVAIKNNNLEAAQILARQDGDIFIPNLNNKTAFEIGVAKGNEFFGILLTPETIQMRDPAGKNIIHYLVKNRSSEALDYCIQNKFPLSDVDRNGFSPLSVAFEGNKNLEDIYIAVKLLLADAIPVGGAYTYFEDAVLARNYSLRTDDGQTPLHFAAIQGQTGIVRYLLERGVPVSVQDSIGATPLHEAVRNGRVDIVAILLEKGANPNTQDVLGKTPLLLSIPRGTQQQTYTLLLANGANSAAKDMYGDTSLHVAIMNNVEVSIFSRLVTPRIDINERNKQGVTPLALAVELTHPDIVSYLVQKGADIHARDFNGGTPLTRALTAFPDMLPLLVPASMVANRDSNGNTPLHIGIQNTSADASLDQIKYLLDVGSDINARNNVGLPPISITLQDNKRFIGEMLILRGAEMYSPNVNNMSPLKQALSYEDGSRDWILLPELIRSTDGSGNTPLHYAAEWKIDRAVSMILDQGANANAKNANGETPLFNAVKVNSSSTVQLLVDRGTAKDGWDSFGNTLFHVGVHWDAHDAVKKLIVLGANIDAKNRAGRSALGESAKTGKAEMVDIFLKNGADANAADTTGKTVLIDAVQNGNPEIVRMLVAGGASPQIQEMHGRNAYHEAADTGNLELITIIHDAGGNPLSRDTKGITPFSSVLKKSPEIVKAVLGNDLNLADSDGNTPLHIAIESKATEENIALLIAMGYPLNRRNRFGVTPLMLAISEKNVSATGLLLQNGSDPYIADNAGECAVSVALKNNSDVLSSIVRLAGTKTDIRGDGVLHYAAQIADSDTIRKLLSMGLDKSIKNVSGETPYDIAVRWEKRDVARLLQ